MELRPDTVTDPVVKAFLQEHLDDMYGNSPACSVHALKPEQLLAPGVSFWTAWDAGSLVGCVALKTLSPVHGEIKTMRTLEKLRGQGIGARLLAHVVQEAGSRGMTQLSLETGSQDFFAPARRLYEKQGFQHCPPFADYTLDANSVFMTLKIANRHPQIGDESRGLSSTPWHRFSRQNGDDPQGQDKNLHRYQLTTQGFGSGLRDRPPHVVLLERLSHMEGVCGSEKADSCIGASRRY
ncbi:GNAT family N-acetyltransferase [Hydrogenophaga sp. 5NK40-0174]|uniref:GNAT family N-acetyltransferase n=1 Tax=Hydrogenophaga sp. 5NK40-0174 TaxID=3127649 RepID=UPI0031076549